MTAFPIPGHCDLMDALLAVANSKVPEAPSDLELHRAASDIASRFRAAAMKVSDTDFEAPKAKVSKGAPGPMAGVYGSPPPPPTQAEQATRERQRLRKKAGRLELWARELASGATVHPLAYVRSKKGHSILNIPIRGEIVHTDDEAYTYCRFPTELGQLWLERFNAIYDGLREALCVGQVVAYRVSTIDGMVPFENQHYWLGHDLRLVVEDGGMARGVYRRMDSPLTWKNCGSTNLRSRPLSRRTRPRPLRNCSSRKRNAHAVSQVKYPSLRPTSDTCGKMAGKVTVGSRMNSIQ